MKAVQFAYGGAADLAAAKAALAGEGVKPAAGTQSLGPMMNLRLVRPAALVDITDVPDLRAVREVPGGVLIGAAITHAEIEDGEIADPTPGWMKSAAGNIAHRAVRNRGTIGGSLAHADPAADWAIVTTGLCAVIHIDGPAGARTLPVENFLTGPFTTALAPGEIIVGVEIPRPGDGARFGYWKYTRQVGEFAKASAAILDDPANGRRRAALGALGGAPRLIADVDGLIEGRLSPQDAVAATVPDLAVPALHVTALTRALAMLDRR